MHAHCAVGVLPLEQQPGEHDFGHFDGYVTAHGSKQALCHGLVAYPLGISGLSQAKKASDQYGTKSLLLWAFFRFGLSKREPVSVCAQGGV